MTDFFNQISNFLQWFWDLCKEGISNLDELPNLFTRVSEYLETVVNYIHPAFIPLLSFAICAALLFRFLRLD